MPIFMKDNKHFMFVHVPKTGGTSLEVVFARSGFATAYIDLGIKGTLNHLRLCPPQHMHAEALQNHFDLDKFDGTFMVVRNPYDRFRSEYCMAHPINCDLSAPAVEAWAAQVFTDLAADGYTRANHLRPQHEFYLPDVAVYKFEQGFTGIIRDIADRYSIQLIKDNVREMARNKNAGIVSSDVDLNPATTEMIDNLYAKDFQQFEYALNP